MLEEILSLSWPAAEFKTPGARLATHLSLSSFSFSLKIKGNEWDFFTKFTHGHGFSNTAGSVRSPLPLFAVKTATIPRPNRLLPLSEVKCLCHHIFSHVWKRSPAYMMQTCVKCSTGVPTYSLHFLRDCVAMNFILNFAFCETWDCDVLSAEIMTRNYGERTKAKDWESGDG